MLLTGANLSYNIIFFLGLASLLGDALSIGFSDFLSIKADLEYQKQRHRPLNHTIIDTIDPKVNDIISFISFIIFGSIPLITFFISNKFYKNHYINTFISTTIALFTLGSIQTYFTKQKWYKTGFEVSAYGIIAAILSYSVAKLISTNL